MSNSVHWVHYTLYRSTNKQDGVTFDAAGEGRLELVRQMEIQALLAQCSSKRRPHKLKGVHQSIHGGE